MKTTVYASRGARQNARTASRASSTSRVEAREAGLAVCGLPYTPAVRRAALARTRESGAGAAPVQSR
nr:hypothetical protein [Streptomyces roseirectus]